MPPVATPLLNFVHWPGTCTSSRLYTMAVQLDGSDDVPGGGMEQCIPLYDVSRPKMSLQQVRYYGH